jgi:Tfp pilus assembly protein PilW
VNRRVGQKRRQAGFTMMELMIATTLGMTLLTVALTLLNQSLEMAAEMEGRLRLNAQARSVFVVLSDGGRNITASGTDGTNEVYGLRRRQTATAGGFRQDYRLNYANNGLTLDGDTLATVTVDCNGTADPLPDCTGAADSETVTGWLGEDVTVENDARSVWDRTVETEFTLVNPYLVRRRRVANSQTIDRYQTIFNQVLEKPKNYP